MDAGDETAAEEENLRALVEELLGKGGCFVFWLCAEKLGRSCWGVTGVVAAASREPSEPDLEWPKAGGVDLRCAN